VVLLRLELVAIERVARRHRRQEHLLVGQLGLRVIGALDVSPQIPRELDGLPRGLEEERLVVGGDGSALLSEARPSICTRIRFPRASAIWQAMVRFQMSS
jgi:hypothetical protein